MILAQITDTHIKPAGRLAYRRVDTSAYLTRAVQHLLALDPKPDVVLATGDLVDAGLPEEYQRLRALLAPLTMPVHVIPGNHDDRDAMRAAFADHAYLPREGFLQYVVEHWPLRLIGLDTVVPRKTGGLMCTERLAWLDERLAEAPDRPTLIFMHHPPFSTGIELMDGFGLDNAEAMREVVRRHPQVESVVCGHLHRPIQARWAGTIASTAPSTGHQVSLDLREQGALEWVMEPPACLLHVWRPGRGVVSHTSYIGDYGGPQPFFENGRLIE